MAGDPSNTSKYGYGWAHRRLRAKLLPKAYGKPCPFCHQPMLRGQDLDLDHPIARALGGQAGPRRMAHASCNRSAGSQLGHQLRRARQQPQRRVNIHSRRW